MCFPLSSPQALVGPYQAPSRFLVGVFAGMEGWEPAPETDFAPVCSSFGSEHLLEAGLAEAVAAACLVPTSLDLASGPQSATMHWRNLCRLLKPLFGLPVLASSHHWHLALELGQAPGPYSVARYQSH